MGSEIGIRSLDHGEELGNDLGYLLKEQRKHDSSERDRGLDIYRSGSAPPTVEGSVSAVGGLFAHHGDVWSAGNNKRGVSEEQLRADPEYINYYYSSVNLNPRLPPPLLSKEDWRSAHRVNGGVGGGVGGSVIGGIGDRRKLGTGEDGGGVGGKCFPGFTGQKGENGGGDSRIGRNEWSGDGLIGLTGLRLGSKQRSIGEIIQDDLNHSTSFSRHVSRPSSCGMYDENIPTSESHFAQLQTSLIPTQNVAASASLTYASALGASLTRSTTPDPQLVATRAPSPCIPPVGEGRVNSFDKQSVSGPTTFGVAKTSPNDSADVMAALSALNLSTDRMLDEENHIRAQFHPGVNDYHVEREILNLRGDDNYMKRNLFLSSADTSSRQQSISNIGKISVPTMSKHVAAIDRSNIYAKANGYVDHRKSAGSSSPTRYHSNGSTSSAIPNYGLSGNNINPALATMMAGQLAGNNLPLLYENAAASAIGVNLAVSRGFGANITPGSNLMAAAAEFQNLTRGGIHTAVPQVPISPMYPQYLRSNEYGTQASGLNDPSMDGVNSYADLLALQQAYLGTLLSSQKPEPGGSYIGQSGALNNGYYGNQRFGLGVGYGGMRHGERNAHLSSGMRNLGAGAMGTWRTVTGGVMDQSFGSSLLDEFKSNKTKCFELLEIAGHVVEFSADQYGSRFIQQKLETATTEEKDMVFDEIIPDALSLMTDVFGNYVVQKFFEHGSSSQIRELADKLNGHVLALSLQMYGCRVIQKAIEVVDLDQKKSMVTELDGHVMRCVRDQNGNHVIQKCIECIPEEAILFIVSTFYDQVVTLSTHPYGCRAIQRILEHCHDPKTQRIVMDEIMLAVCMLAQDQYGNYVVQHVLEHGKPEERSAIITKLTGKIVQMSQQKFASNVIEKCLTFGDPAERRTMVNEMLGTTEENEPLQVMMKDQFANYVVQKVLETCEDQQLELILSRIKIHLNALKKYTYGKHIVARVEKLVAAGERRIGMLSGYAAAPTSVA